MNANRISDPERWVDLYGDDLYRYALFRLREPEGAEDAVQETLLAAFRARETFSGQSSEKTWLFGILKHKVADHLRRISRERVFAALESPVDGAEKLFDERGKWRVQPGKWAADPNTLLEKKEFWQILERCLSNLPSLLSQVFSLREMDRLGTGEICKVLNVSATNLWVMLHRARTRLRRCLEVNWFDSKGKRNE